MENSRVHKFKQNGYYIAIDVNSGAVHLLDNIAYDILDYIQVQMPSQCPQNILAELNAKYPVEEIVQTYNELYQLQENQQLFTEDTYQKFSNMMVDSPIKSLCLHIAHDCNLRCQYCFASTGDFGKGRKLMPLETGKKAIDFLIEKSQNRHNLELDFFGGEPLMNFDVVKEIVAYARQQEKIHNKNFRFTITTNGMLLDDEKIDFINREMSNVVLSIDGREEVNDRMRTRIDHSGSYKSIVPKFKKLVEKRRGKYTDYYVRGTFTKYNLDFAKDVQHLYELGFEQISVEPVVTSPDMPYALTEEDLPVIFAEYERLAKQLIADRKAGKFYNFFHFMIDLNQGPCAIKRLRGCGCGNEYVAITPDGDIYPCHQFVGMSQWKMGNLEENTLDVEKKNYFAKTNVYHKEECKNCWNRFYCSGGCNANNYQYGGDVLRVHPLSCELQKKRTECAIMVQAALAE